MTTKTAPSPLVLINNVSWESYSALLDALPEHRLRHTYDRGALEMRSVLYNVSWRQYEQVLAAFGERRLRHTYDRGMLEMMSPLQVHDWVKSLLGRMIEFLAFEINQPIKSVGSTTFRQAARERGLEADESYFIANEPKVRGRDDYDPENDPPPDLAVEVDVTSSSVERLPVYAALQVPEIWRHDGDSLRFLRLSEHGEYEPISHSIAFPFLKPGDVSRFLEQRHEMDENSLVRAFVESAKSLRDQMENS